MIFAVVRISSAVEQLTVNQLVASSNLASGVPHKRSLSEPWSDKLLFLLKSPVHPKPSLCYADTSCLSRSVLLIADNTSNQGFCIELLF